MSRVALLALSAVLAGLAIFVVRAHPRDRVKTWFALFTFFVSCWALGVGGLQGGTHLELWGRFTFASAILIPAAFFAFTYYYPSPSPWPPRALLRATLVFGGLLSLLTLTTPLLVHHVAFGEDGLSRSTGPVYPPFVVYFIAAWLVALATFIGKWRRARGLERAQLQYLGTGIVVSVGGGSTVNFLLPLVTGRSTYSWLGPSFALVLILMVVHAIIRHRLMDLRLVIHRGVAYVACSAFVSAAVLATARFALGRGSDISVHSDVLIVLVTILLTTSTPVYRLFMTFIDPYLYRRPVDYPVMLKDATHKLSRLMEPHQLSIQLREILMVTLVPDRFFLLARADSQLQILPTDDSLPLSASVAMDGPIVGLLNALPKPSVLLVSEAPDTGIAGDAQARLRTLGIEAVMILGRRGELLGAAFLGARRSGDAYFTADISFLESLAELTSISLENGLLYRGRIAALEYSERLLESINSAVVAVDATGHITSLNPAALSLFDLSRDAKSFAVSDLPTEIAWALLLAVRGAWQPREVEATVPHPARGDVPVILSAAILHEPTGATAGALVVVTDLSNVKALERHQRRVEHFATMARFYAGIAHEIRSPLTSISNFVAMLTDRFEDAEYRETAARLLPNEVSRIVRLADRLRLMAPSESGALKPVPLHTLLSDIIAIHAPAAAEHGVTLVLTSPRELPSVFADQAQLVQLFVNLINNAVESMPANGVVTVEADVSLRVGNPTVTVRVIDNGCGVDPGLRGKIFEPFFTTKPHGTGLGLAICQEISAFHHATLKILPRVDAPGTIAVVEFDAIHQTVSLGHGGDTSAALPSTRSVEGNVRL